ncbi:MAG: hypothetical protein JWO45_1740 [Spartobacteria bacterium]|nr:hypothetical protein [Spartobacteria bacterium]
MRSLKTFSLSAVLSSVLLVSGGQGQQPTPMIIVQAANAAPSGTPVVAAPPNAETGSAIDAATKALEQVKAVNEETLKKQETVLQQLDELQKAAEQLKIFSKRV